MITKEDRKTELIAKVLDDMASMTLDDIEELLSITKTENIKDEILARLQKEVTEFVKNQKTLDVNEVISWLITKFLNKNMDFVLISIAFQILSLGVSEEDKIKSDLYFKLNKRSWENIGTFNKEPI